MMRRSLVALMIALQLHAGAAWAFDLGGTREAQAPPSLTSEYIYRTHTEEALIPVYLLGAVAKPGLYHVPSRTDIVGLLTLAGGPVAGAQIDNILIKGQNAADTNRRIRFDLEDAMDSRSVEKIQLLSNDLVYVAPAKPPVSGGVLTAIGIVGGLLGIVLTGFLISNYSKN